MTEGLALGSRETGEGRLKGKPNWGGVEWKGLLRRPSKLGSGHRSGSSHPPPPLLQTGKTKQAELSVVGGRGEGGRSGVVQGPDPWPQGPRLRVPRKRGGGVDRPSQGSLPREEATGTADSHVQEGDSVLVPKRQPPYRRVELHVSIDPDKPGLRELNPLGRRQLALSLGEVPLPLAPCPARPRAEDDEGGAAGTRRDEGASISEALEATGGEEFPEMTLVGDRVVVVRAGEDLSVLVRMRQGKP
jgi:hypothetical protein